MDLQFGSDDEAGFAAARGELVGAFETWLRQGGRPPDLVSDAGLVLDLKWSHLDGDLGFWTVGHLNELLLELYPRKVSAGPELVDSTLPSLGALLEFLDDEGLLADSSDPPRRLRAALDQLSGPFREAMADRSKWGLAESLFGAMADDGVDPLDEGAREAWIGEFNAGSVEDRDEVLGPPMERMRRATVPLQRLRPVVLAPVEQLETAARSAPAMHRFVGLVEHVAEPRPLTDRGNLKLADARTLVEALDTGDVMDETIGERTFRTRSSTELTTLDLTFRWARAAGFVKVRKGRLSATQWGRSLGEDPLESAYRALLALMEVGVLTHRRGEDRYGFGWYAQDVDAELSGIPEDRLEMDRGFVEHTSGGSSTGWPSSGS